MNSGDLEQMDTEEKQEVEVTAKVARRKFTAEYKLKVLREADACGKKGEIGALLRREGLYTSHLSYWRKLRSIGELGGLSPKKRGPAAKEKNPLAGKLAALERENAKMKARAERAEALVELQKKMAEILQVDQEKENRKN